MKSLKVYIQILSAIVLLCLFSCASRQAKSDLPFPGAPGEELYQVAEKKFQEKEYQAALEFYRDYLNLYPDSPLSPGAVLKTGLIFSAQSQYEKAREIYNSVADRYPESPFVKDANVEILAIDYYEGKYDLVIEKGNQINDRTLSHATLLRKYRVLTDAYMARGDLKKATDAFFHVYYESGEKERAKTLFMLQKVVDAFSFEEVEAAIEKTEDEELRSFFTYKLGMKYAADERYEKAIQVLSAFIEEFPGDPKADTSSGLIAALREKAEYNHNTIGCMLPLSGRYKAFGTRALRGIEFAMTRFSMANPESPVQIIIRDTAADPEKAVEAVQDFADARVAAIIGPILTAEPAAIEAQKRKIPIITLTQKDQIVEIGDYVFRHFLTPETQVRTLLEYVVERLGIGRIAILYPEEKYGITFMNKMWDEMVSYGGEVVGVESYRADQSDFADAIKKLVGLYYEVPDELKEMIQNTLPPSAQIAEGEDEIGAIVDFDALFIPDGPEKVGLILPALTYHDVTHILLMGTNLWHSEKLIKMTGEHSRDAIMPEIFFSESRRPQVTEFVTLFEDAYDQKPGFIEALSYDTGMILFNTIVRADIHFRSSIKNELLNLKTYDGVTGPTEFDVNGETLKRLYLLQITRKGEFVELEH